MQPRLDRAHRYTRKVLNLLQLITLRVMQEHDKPVVFAELLQCCVEPLELLDALAVRDRVEIAGEVHDAVTGQMPFVDEKHALPREAAVSIHKQVVHDATQPGSRLLDFHELVEHAERLDQQFLEQVLGFGLRAGKSPCESIQPVEMRLYDAFENIGLLRIGHYTGECIATGRSADKELACYSGRNPYRAMKAHTLALTSVAMVAFAANSVLCRLALGSGLIDAASFATARTVAGAIVLGAILLMRSSQDYGKPDWRSVVTLYLYMVFFAFAYLSLSAGTGALVLFAAVQLTMFVVALRSGERFSLLSWTGFAAALAGLVVLFAPGITAPDPRGAALMVVAGVSWGVYSLVGRSAGDATAATANNFLYAVPLVVLTSFAFRDSAHVTPTGAGYAILSGAIASGLGYVTWYAALRGLSATNAATVQLSVPVIAALGGVVFLSEAVTLRLVLASIVTLGGVALVLSQRNSRRL